MLLPTPLEKNAGWPGEEGALVPSAEENKAIVRRFLEETAKENFDVIDELVDPDFVDLSLQPGQEPDR
jgi:predicted ester cyclase